MGGEERLKKSSMSLASYFQSSDFLGMVMVFSGCVIPWLVWSQVQIPVYCCCCCCGIGGWLAASTPRSSWLSIKLLVSGYWLLSKGMWWTLWTCVFRFPFWEARYGQSWQQNGLSPEEHTHNTHMKLKDQVAAREDFIHSRWSGQDFLDNFEFTQDLTRHNDINHWGDLLRDRGVWKKQTHRHKPRHMMAFS